jgi:hypothetical protein
MAHRSAFYSPLPLGEGLRGEGRSRTRRRNDIGMTAAVKNSSAHSRPFSERIALALLRADLVVRSLRVAEFVEQIVQELVR